MKSFSEVLMAQLKDKGLDLAEDVAGLVVEAVFDAAAEVFAATENKYDDLTIPLLGIAKPAILQLIDKIDGEVG